MFCKSNFDEAEKKCPFCGSSVYKIDGRVHVFQLAPGAVGISTGSNTFFHTPLAWCINSFDGGHAFTSGSDICKLCGMTRSEAEKDKKLPDLPTGLKTGCVCGSDKTYGPGNTFHAFWCSEYKEK
jgi:hypothetical protein